MVYLYLIILLLYLIIFVLSRKENAEAYTKKMTDKTYPGKILFVKAAIWCIGLKKMLSSQLGRDGKTQNRQLYKERLQISDLGKKLKLLNPEISESQQLKDFDIQRYSLVLLMIFIGNIVALCMTISIQSSSLLQENGHIKRNAYGNGDIEIVLSAHMEGKEAEEILYTVEEQKPSKEEIIRLYEEAAGLLPELILGDNSGLEAVAKNLKLVNEIEGYPFKISWESSSYSLLHTDGTVKNEMLEKPEVVTLKACFQYDGMEFEEVFPIQIQPVEYSEEELLIKNIEAALEEQNQVSRTDGEMALPDRIESVSVIWEEVKQDSSGYFLLFMCIAAILVFVLQNKEVDKNLEKREKELLLDYPEVINKLTLYMGAGMTTRNAFLKMGEDYKKQKPSGKKRYVYEEVLLLCHELQSGISESGAYTHFGKRCGLQQYMKLSALLAQNIRKGNSNLLKMMRQEADAAFEERKNTAKKLGEEAGTKLLIPMMMMLCIVMVIIMIPAYFSFSA